MIPNLSDIGDIETTADLGTPESNTVVPTPTLAGMPIDGGIDSSNIQAALDGAAAAQVEELETAKAEATPESPEQVQKSRAQQRIQQIIAERNEERKQREVLQSQLIAAQTEQNRLNAEFQKRQLDMEQRRFEMAQARDRAEAEANLSDVDRARAKFLADAAKTAREELRKEMEPELKALREHQEQDKQARAQAQAQADTAQRLQYFQSRAEQALTSEIMKGYAPEDVSSLKDEMEEMLYSFAGAFGADPVDIAPKFKQFISKVVKAENKKVSRTAATTIAKSQGTVAPLPAGRTSNGTQALPTMAQLKKAGFDNYVQWRGRGAPAVQ